jgi:aryl-alcohol dehydrogenase-like predicted oxidoreductase
VSRPPAVPGADHPGSRDLDRVAENVAAAGFTLTAEDLARVAGIAPVGGVGGSRD